MFNEAKSLLLPATLAYAGVRGSAMLGATSAWAQAGAGVLGALAGLWVARKIKP
jgi:hypothetical protein